MDITPLKAKGQTGYWLRGHEQLLLLYSWRFFPLQRAPSLAGSWSRDIWQRNCFLPNAMSGQHCKNYDVKQETVHCYPRNVDRWTLHVIRACSWRWPDVVARISPHFSKFAFVLFCYVTNHLLTGPLGNSEFCFPWISMFPSTSSRETLRFSGNKIRDQSLSVYCFSKIQFVGQKKYRDKTSFSS